MTTTNEQVQMATATRIQSALCALGIDAHLHLRNVDEDEEEHVPASLLSLGIELGDDDYEWTDRSPDGFRVACGSNGRFYVAWIDTLAETTVISVVVDQDPLLGL